MLSGELHNFNREHLVQHFKRSADELSGLRLYELPKIHIDQYQYSISFINY